MRRLAPLVAICAALAAAGGARAATVVVYPTGLYPLDVENVQAAVDQGGTVLLKATNEAGVPTAFDFGPPVVGPGWVDVQLDTELVGERTAVAATTIDGGWGPIAGFGAADVAVRDIDFRSPLENAILFVASPFADIEITGNRISHVVGRAIGSRTYAEAIVARGGRIAIDDNIVTDVDAFNGIGISEFRSPGPVEVLRNDVTGTTNTAIESTSNTGPTRIADNLLRPGPSAASGGVAGYGIEINGRGQFTVEHNDIVIESPGGIGIWAFGAVGFDFGAMTDPVIAWNHVALRPVTTIDGRLYDDGIDLAGLVSGAYIGQNTIEGSGFSAFNLFAASFDPETQPSDLGSNTLVGNEISRVAAEAADVVLDVPTHDTVLKGLSGSVLDLGTNNRITGFTKSRQSGSGPQVSDAVRLRNGVTQAFAAPLPDGR